VRISYLIGGLLVDNLTPEKEQEKLNQRGEDGWMLTSVTRPKRFFFYVAHFPGLRRVDY
jgi:hypothetical protein